MPWPEHLLGDIAMAIDAPDIAGAEGHYRTAAKIAIELGIRPLLMECQLSLGVAARRAGREADAQSEFELTRGPAHEMAIACSISELQSEVH
jgi:hypothetical protein